MNKRKLRALILMLGAIFMAFFYGYKAYLNAHVNVASVVKAYGNCLWLAKYPGQN